MKSLKLNKGNRISSELYNMIIMLCKASSLNLMLCLLLYTPLFSQSKYPSWFLNQGSIKGKTAVAFITKPSYRDSTIPYLKQMGSLQFLYQSNVGIKIKTGYVGSPQGFFLAKSEIVENLDTATFFELLPRVKVVDFATIGNEIIGLVALDEDIKLSRSDTKKQIMPKTPPKWAESIPANSSYYFAIGVSSGGVYESGAWMRSEKNARAELAKQSGTLKLKSYQKKTFSRLDEVATEGTFFKLRDIRFIRRWKDEKRNIFFVLSSMPK